MSTIRSCLACVKVNDVRTARDALLAAHFSATERTVLADAPVQTIAGRLALKRAVRSVLPELTDPVEIVASTRGAPELAASGVAPIFLSVSHTADFAYGLAVRQEASHA